MDAAVALSASVLVLAVGLNVLLTAGIVRRTRRLQTKLAPHVINAEGPRTGDAVGAFESGALDGSTITGESLAASPTLVGFFAARCRPSERLRDELLARPPALPMIAFVVGLTPPGHDDPAEHELAASLGAIARVAIAPVGGPIVRAFRANAYPSLMRLERGRIAEVLR